MLPITHVLYVGSALFVVGLYLSLGARRYAPVANAALGLGLCLLALAFARYWGAAQGQLIAVAIPSLLFMRGLLPGHGGPADAPPGGPQ